MFPELPEDLAALTDEELADLHEQFLSVHRNIRARDDETLGDRGAEAIIAETEAGRDAVKAIVAEQETRQEAERNFAAKLDELTSDAGADETDQVAEAEGTDDDSDAKGDETDADSDDDSDTATDEVEQEQPEAVAAAAARPLRRPLPRGPRRNRPKASAALDTGGLLARQNSQEIGVEYGEQIDRKKLGELANFMIKRNRVNPGDKAVIASVTYPYPEERFLDRSYESNAEKIRAVTGPKALTASGGLCAPLTPIYDLPGVETAARPVRDALPSFQANRGGVIVGETPTMTVYDDAVGIITAANNEIGGSVAVKNCMRIECPDYNSVEVDSIYQCVEADNLAARANPELMARIDELVRAEHARLADGRLLGIIRAGSTSVTGIAAADGGALYNLLGDIASLASAYRSRNRMPLDARLQVLMPGYLGDMLALDSSRAAARTGEIGRGQIAAYLERFAISVTWYLDTPLDANGDPLGVTQIAGAQAGGARNQFPDSTQWGLFAPGTWLHLDSGVLDLGVVRDSSLNSTNDFQNFAEGWEQATKVGVESIWVTSSLCANGTFAAGVDDSAVCD